MMKTMQSFLLFFYILDQCYDQYKEDDLGGFLGAISPELWGNGQPTDKAIFNDWKKMSESETISKNNILKKTYDFLNSYEKQFGFVFSKTKEVLETMFTAQMLENAEEKAQILYEKYNYND